MRQWNWMAAQENVAVMDHAGRNMLQIVENLKGRICYKDIPSSKPKRVDGVDDEDSPEGDNRLFQNIRSSL